MDDLHDGVDCRVADDPTREERDDRFEAGRRNAVVEDDQDARTDSRRNAEEKREPERGGADVATKEQHARRRPRARNTREDRNALDRTNEDRIEQVGVLLATDADGFARAFEDSCKDQQDADERDEHPTRKFAREIDQREVQWDTDDAGHETGDDDEGGVGVRVLKRGSGPPARRGMDRLADGVAVVDRRRNGRPHLEEQRELDGDLRRCPDRGEKQREVSRTGDRQPLDESLDDTGGERNEDLAESTHYSEERSSRQKGCRSAIQGTVTRRSGRARLSRTFFRSDSLYSPSLLTGA